MSLKLLFFVGLLAPFKLVTAQAVPLSPTQARRAESLGTRPRLGDTVAIAGRAILGTNVVDTSRVSIYIQDASGAGIHLVGDRGMAIPPVYTGDSVLAVGVLAPSRGGAQLIHAMVSVVAGARRATVPLVDDVQAVVLSQAMRRRLLIIATLVGALLVLLAIAVRVGQMLRAAQATAERALRESEVRYRLLVEQAPVGILVHRRGRVLFANAAFTTVLRIPANRQPVGAALVDLVHRDDGGRLHGWLNRPDGQRDAAARTRERFTRIDGTPVEMEIVTTSTIFAGEEASQVAVHDVTAQSLLEGQLRHAQKMEAVGQLAAGVAHDFNNILTAIAGYTQLILDERTLSEAVRKDVAEIQRAGERASGLTKQLRSLSRRQLVRAEVLDLNDVICSSEQLLRRTIGAGVSLDFALAAGPCSVLADSGQLEHVLMNLVLNARDAMTTDGAIHVETTLRTMGESQSSGIEVPAGDYVALVVRDTGAGMPPETLRRVFEPFFTTKEVGEGTGLGLASVYGIVTGAQGFIWAESVVDVGTEFTVLLPCAERAASEPRGSAVVATAPASCARILLIEDEASVRAAARRILERDGFAVHEAKNASDAALLWEERGRTFACIVTDVMMPGLRGPELIEQFRRDRRDIPVLFVSGYTDRALGRLDLEVPNTSFLQKPFQPKQLSAAVSMLLRNAAITTR